MTNWVPSDYRLGIPNMAQTDSIPNQITGSNQLWPLFTIAKASDSTLGAGEFIYLSGLSGLAVGDLVTYNPLTGAVTLTTNAGNQGSPVEVAMAANTTTANYSWFQISGVATILKLTTVNFLPAVKLFQSATAGLVTSASASGLEIENAITVNAATVASATTTVQVLINRPFLQGNIT